jgi:hypothetical protein
LQDARANELFSLLSHEAVHRVHGVGSSYRPCKDDETLRSVPAVGERLFAEQGESWPRRCLLLLGDLEGVHTQDGVDDEHVGQESVGVGTIGLGEGRGIWLVPILDVRALGAVSQPDQASFEVLDVGFVEVGVLAGEEDEMGPEVLALEVTVDTVARDVGLADVGCLPVAP